MFELIQLRCFLAVARELHFGRAAASLNITQPPLSRHIQVLERILGITLFHRSSRSVKLTTAGTAFLSEANRIIEMAEGAVNVARAAADGEEGVISLGFTAASGYSYMPRLVGFMQEHMPSVGTILKEMVTGKQLEALTTGRIDIGLMRLSSQRPELESQKVLKERFIVCSPKTIPEASRPQRIADFDRLPLIMYAPDKARYFHDLLTSLFTSASADPKRVQHVAQIHSILMLVSAGQGFALVPESSRRLRPDGVVFSELEDAKPIVELHAVWRKEHENPALSVLLSHLDEVGQHIERARLLVDG